MSQKKSIIIGAAIGVGTLALLTFILVFAVGENEQKVCHEPLFERQRDELSGINVTNAQGGFSLEKSGGELLPSEMQGVPVGVDAVNNVINGLLNLELGTVVSEDPPLLEKYNLAEPATNVEVLFEDGSSALLYIGEQINGECFWKMADEATVRKSPQSVFECFAGNTRRFAYMDLGQNIPVDLVQKLELKSANDAIILEREGQRLVQTAPISADADMGFVRGLLADTNMMMASEAVRLHPTPDEIRQFGLDAPEMELHITTETITAYRCGIATEGSVYVMWNNIPAIYLVPLEQLPWYGTDFRTFIPTILPKMEFSDIKTLQISGEKLFEFKLSDENADSDERAVTLSGRAVDMKRFKQFLDGIGKIPYKTKVEEPQKQPNLIVVYHYTDSETAPSTISFYENGEDSVVKTELGYFKTDSEAVRYIISTAESFLKAEN